jgi:hypothetical protein
MGTKAPINVQNKSLVFVLRCAWLHPSRLGGDQWLNGHCWPACRLHLHHTAACSASESADFSGTHADEYCRSVLGSALKRSRRTGLDLVCQVLEARYKAT